MGPEAALQQAIEDQPGDDTAWLVLADWLEESGQPDRAELLRLQVGLRQDLGSRDRDARQRRLQALLRAGTYPWAARRQLRLGRGAELTLVLVPPGRFLMGSPETELGRDSTEGPQHPVTLTRGFWMSAYPVTKAQWKAVMGGDPGGHASDARPVVEVSWFDAQELCRRLTKRTARLFRLPSEAEWEHACRAGTTTPYFTGEGLDALKLAGWCNYDAMAGIESGAQPVSSYLPNAFGLYDTHGNVWEWCSDWFGPYPEDHVTDPAGPKRGEAEAGRVVRGGSWYFAPRIARSAYRYHYAPDYASSSHGCRVVMSEPAP